MVQTVTMLVETVRFRCGHRAMSLQYQADAFLMWFVSQESNQTA
jgi:hypothetical protein